MEIKINANKKLKKLNGFWKGIHFCPTDAIEDDWGYGFTNKQIGRAHV